MQLAKKSVSRKNYLAKKNKKLRHSQMNRMKRFITSRPALQEMLKGGLSESTPDRKLKPHKYIKSTCRENYEDK